MNKYSIPSVPLRVSAQTQICSPQTTVRNPPIFLIPCGMSRSKLGGIPALTPLPKREIPQAMMTRRITQERAAILLHRRSWIPISSIIASPPTSIRWSASFPSRKTTRTSGARSMNTFDSPCALLAIIEMRQSRWRIASFRFRHIGWDNVLLVSFGSLRRISPLKLAKYSFRCFHFSDNVQKLSSRAQYRWEKRKKAHANVHWTVFSEFSICFNPGKIWCCVVYTEFGGVRVADGCLEVTPLLGGQGGSLMRSPLVWMYMYICLQIKSGACWCRL